MGRKSGLFIALALSCSLAAGKCSAFLCSWNAGPGAGFWSVAANWTGCNGTIPQSGDTAQFSAIVGVSTMDVTVNVATISITNLYTGTIFQSTNTITVSTWTQNGGTFNTLSTTTNTITINTNNGFFNLTGGNYTLGSNAVAMNGAVWIVNGGVFTAGTSTVTFNNGSVASYSLTGSATFYNLQLNLTGNQIAAIASGSTQTVKGLLTLSETGNNNNNFNTGVLESQGDIHLSGTIGGAGGSATVLIDGTGTQNLTGGMAATPNVTISKTAGTLNLSSATTVAGNWTNNNFGTSIVNAVSGSTVTFGSNTATFTGSTTFYNLQFTGGNTQTIAAASTMTASNILTLAKTSQSLQTGTLAAQGDINLSGTSSNLNNNFTLLINGAGTQNLIGGVEALGNVSISKTAGTLNISSGVTANNNWINNNLGGTVSAVAGSTVTLTFQATNNITSGGETLANLVFNGTGNKTITQTDAITLSEGLKLAAGTLAGGGKAISLSGNWTVSGGTYTASNSTVTFNGSGVQTLTGSTTFYSLTDTTAGNTLTIVAGSTQTVPGLLTLTGACGSLININSGTPGTFGYLKVTGSSVVKVNVTDNSNSGTSIAAGGDSTLSNTAGWTNTGSATCAGATSGFWRTLTGVGP